MAVSQDELQFVQGVSSQTGIDPRVLIAWIASEGHPGDLYHNYLNIAGPTAASLGVPTVGTAAANTAEFGDAQTGIDATVKEIRSLGLTHLAHEPPASAISQIAASPWASSHYGGPGGPNLRNTFASLFGSGALSSAWEPPTATGMAGDKVGIQTGNVGTAGFGSAGSAVAGAASGVADSVLGPIHSVEGLIKFLTSWRFAEIVGGFLLLLVGLVLLGRQFGLQVPAPGPFARSASEADSTFAFEPGERSARARQASRRTSREGTARRTRSHTLAADRPAGRRSSGRGPGSTIPF